MRATVTTLHAPSILDPPKKAQGRGGSATGCFRRHCGGEREEREGHNVLHDVGKREGRGTMEEREIWGDER